MPKTITGFIQNKTGRPLETVTVVIKGTTPGTATVTPPAITAHHTETPAPNRSKGLVPGYGPRAQLKGYIK